MYSLEELKKKSKNYKSEIGPSREDVLYQKYTESKPQKMKVSGGTVNPTIVPDRERESYATLLKKSERDKKTLEYHTKPTIAPDRQTLREMIFGKSKQGGTVNPTISAADFSTRYDTMADKEKSIYSSYKRAGKEEEAKAYLKAIEPEINKRAAEKRVAEAEQLAKDSTVGGLYARYMASLAEPLGTIYGLVQESRGEAIDPYHPLFLGQQIKEGQEAGFIGADTGMKKYMKQAALGAFDWGTQAATLGAAGLAGKGLKRGTQVLYGSGAFGGNLRDATLRGGTTEEAILYGAAGAAAETLAEGFGFEKWMKLADTIKLGGRKGDLVKHILKSAGTEALEEGATEGANLLADTLLLGDKSRMAETYQAARMQGMEEGRATWEAIKAGAVQIGESTLVGGMSGGMIGGGIGALTYGTQRNPLDYTEEQKMQMEAARQERAAAAQAVETGEKAVENQTVLPERGEAFFHEKGQEAFQQEAEKRGNMAFLPAFLTYYTAGLSGTAEADIQQTEETAVADRGLLTAAFLAGNADRKADIEARLSGRHKMGQTAGVFLETEAATEEQKAICNLVAKVGGMEVVLVDKLDDGQKNGEYHVQKGKMVIALENDSFLGTVFHESTHYIREANPEGYDRMQKAVFTMAAKTEGLRLDEYMEAYQKRYGENVENISDILEEMTADAFQKIAADEGSLRELLQEMERENKGILAQIKEFLDKLLESLQGLLKDNRFSSFAEELHKDVKHTKKLQKIFAEELKKAGELQREGEADNKMPEGKKYSLNPNFPAQYAAWDGKKFTAFRIGTTSEALKEIGIETKNIIWHSEKINKIKRKHEGMTDEIVKQVPQILENPIIIMKSKQENEKNNDGGTSRIVLFGEVRDANGNPVLAALELQPRNKKDMILDFQVIASAYGKTTKMKRFIEESEVLYLDTNKKRTDTWLKSFGLQLPSGITMYGSIGSVSYEAEGVKIEGIPFKALNSVPDVKFSIREEEYEVSIEEKEELKKANRDLKQILLILGEDLAGESEIKKALEGWKKKYGGTFRTDDFKKRFTELLHFSIEKGEQMDTRKIMAATCALAEEMLQNSNRKNTRAKEAFQELWDEIRSTKIKISDKMRMGLEPYGGYNTFRTEYFGRLQLSTRDGAEIDTIYRKLQQKYPDFFPNAEKPTEMLLQMGAVMDILKPSADNPYGYDMKGYALDAAYELWDRLLNQISVPEEKQEAIYEPRKGFRMEIGNIRKEAAEREAGILAKIAEKTDGMTIAQQKEWARTQRGYYVEKLNRQRERMQEKKEHAEYAKHRRQIERDVKSLLKWIQKPTNRYHVPQRYMEQLSAILVKLDSGNREVKILQSDLQGMLAAMEERTTGQNAESSTEGSDQPYVDEATEKDITTYLKNLATAIGRKGGSLRLAELTNEQIDWLRRAISGLKHSLTEANKLYGTKRAKTVEALGKAYIAEATDKKSASKNQAVRAIMDFMGLSMLTPETFLKGVSERVYDVFWKGYSDGLARKTLHTEEARSFMNELLPEKTAAKWEKEAPKKIETTDKYGKQQEVYMTIPQIMYLYCAMRRKQAMQHLIGGERETADGVQYIPGGGFSVEPEERFRIKGRKEMEGMLKQAELFVLEERELRRITDLLTEEQKQVAEKMQEFLSTTVAEWGNEVSMELYGYEKFTEDYYIPIQSNEAYLTAIFGKEGRSQRTLENMGAAKSINEYANNPIVISNIFEVFSRHIDQMTSYNGFVPILSDTNKFLNYKEMPKRVYDKLTTAEKDALRETMTKEEAEEWNGLMENVEENLRAEEIDVAKLYGEGQAQDGAETIKPESVRTHIERTLGKKAMQYWDKLMIDINNAAGTDDVGILPKTLLRNVKVASVGANLRVVLQQPVSILRAWAEIDMKYILGATFAGRNDWNKIYKNAPIFRWKEWGGAEMDTGRTLKQLITGTTGKEKLIEKSMSLAGMMDKLTWGRIWKACELEVKRKYPELQGDRLDEKIGERATEIIDRTQVVDSVLHRSENMRSKSFYMKMTTSFMSEPIKTYNMAFDAIRELAQNKKSKEAWRKASRTILTLTANGILVSIAAGFADALRDDDDPEEETFLEKWKRAVMGDYSGAETTKDKFLAFWASNLNDNLNPMNMIPFLKDISSLIGGYDIKRTEFSGISDLVNCCNVWMKYIEGESTYTLNGMLRYTAGQLSKAMGIPYKSLERDLVAIKDSILNHTLGTEWMQETTGIDKGKQLAMLYQNRKLTYAIGSEKNVKLYTKLMLEAAFNGDRELAQKIYGELLEAGISAETLESRMKSNEKERVQREPLAAEAIEAYKAADYLTYTKKMDELRELGYTQDSIEKALRTLYKEKYGEEEAKTFAEASETIWEEAEKMEKEDFQSVLEAVVAEKTGGAVSKATELFNYMVHTGLDNDSIRSGINSVEKKQIKENPLVLEGAEAYYNADIDSFLSVVDSFQAEGYFTENIYDAIKEKAEELYGKDDPGIFEDITDEYWEEDTADTGADYGMLFNAWNSGDTAAYERMWDILADSGRKNGNIRSSMRSRLEKEYWRAEHAGEIEQRDRAYQQYLALGGKHETLMKKE